MLLLLLLKISYVKALKPADHHHVVGHFGHDGHNVEGSRQRFDFVLKRATQVVRIGSVGAQVAVATPPGQNVQSFLSVAHQVSQQQLIPAEPHKHADIERVET